MNKTHGDGEHEVDPEARTVFVDTAPYSLCGPEDSPVNGASATVVRSVSCMWAQAGR